MKNKKIVERAREFMDGHHGETTMSVRDGDRLCGILFGRADIDPAPLDGINWHKTLLDNYASSMGEGLALAKAVVVSYNAHETGYARQVLRPHYDRALALIAKANGEMK